MDGLIATVKHVGPDGMPRAPWEIQDALEQWARKSGRHAKMHFFPPAGWFARLELKDTDPRRQYGHTDSGEDVFFQIRNPYEHQYLSIPDVKAANKHFKNLPLIDWWGGQKVRLPMYFQLDILQMGASGVTNFLESEDTWSGRGIHGTDSIEKITADRVRMDRDAKAKMEEQSAVKAGERAKDYRRKILNIPFIGVLFGKSRPGNRGKES